MTNLTNSLLAAVALVAAAGSASAQNTLKAEIPFAFRAGEVNMAAGVYQVMTSGSLPSKSVRLYNETERKSAVLLVEFDDASKEWLKAGVPKISFYCVDGRCSLAQIWKGDSRDAMTIRGHRVGSRDYAKLQIITFDLKAE